MMLLSMVHASEVLQGKREGRGDTSQVQNWSNFRNASVDKVRELLLQRGGTGRQRTTYGGTSQTDLRTDLRVLFRLTVSPRQIVVLL